MSDVTDALHALGIDEWVLRGTPTSEAEFQQMFRKVTGKDKNDIAIESDNPSDFGVTWSQVSAKITELQDAQPMRLLRVERNRKLAETDWWGVSDQTMTQAQTDYRKALRDIPQQSGFPSDVTWPTKP